MSIRLEEIKAKEKKNVNVNTHTHSLPSKHQLLSGREKGKGKKKECEHTHTLFSIKTSATLLQLLPSNLALILTVAEIIQCSTQLNPLSVLQPKPLSHLSQKMPSEPVRISPRSC